MVAKQQLPKERCVADGVGVGDGVVLDGASSKVACIGRGGSGQSTGDASRHSSSGGDCRAVQSKANVTIRARSIMPFTSKVTMAAVRLDSVATVSALAGLLECTAAAPVA